MKEKGGREGEKIAFSFLGSFFVCVCVGVCVSVSVFEKVGVWFRFLFAPKYVSTIIYELLRVCVTVDLFSLFFFNCK